MKKIIDYITCIAQKSKWLDELVCQNIEKGYQPYGEQIKLPDRAPEDFNWRQVMVKYES